MRFPTASWPQVRKEVGRQLSDVPAARCQAAAALALLTAGAGSNVAIPILLGKIVDAVITQGAIVPIGISLVLVAAVSALFSAAGFYVLSRQSERVISALREDMVSTALRLPTHRVEEAGTGDLVSRSTDDVAELSAAVTETVPVLAKSAFAIATTGVALVSLNWQSTGSRRSYAAIFHCCAPVPAARSTTLYRRTRCHGGTGTQAPGGNSRAKDCARLWHGRPDACRY